MLEKTKQTNEKMIAMKTASSGWGYTSPEYLSATISEQTREKKAEEDQMRKEITAKVRNDMPAASDQAVDATVTRLIYEKQLLAK